LQNWSQRLGHNTTRGVLSWSREHGAVSKPMLVLVPDPRVGVVVPSHSSRYLRYALQSLASQTTEIEVVVVDDGSPDGEVSRMAREFGFGFVRNTYSEGPPTARNIGIDALHRPWIVNLDADNIVAPRFVERLLRVAERRPRTGISYCRALQFGEAIGPYAPVVRRLSMHLGHANFIDASSMFARRAWHEAGGWDPNAFPYSDWDFWLSIVEKGWRLGFEPEHLLWYRVRSSGILRSTGEEQFESARTYIRSKHAAFLVDRDPARLRYVIPRILCHIQRRIDARNVPDEITQPMRVVVVGSSQDPQSQDVLDTINDGLPYEAVAFLDDADAPIAAEFFGLPVLGPPTRMFDAFTLPARGAVVASSDGRDRERLGDLAVEAGFQLPSLVHPRSRVAPTARLGTGTFVAADASVGPRAEVGTLVVISSNAVVGADAEVHDYVTLSRGVEVGDRSTIGRCADVREGAKVLAGVTVGENAVIKAGALVSEDVPSGAIVAGESGAP
jgi:sugar O-acyltransferase (sialic acid O-acetyltransferase NeuD family)